MKNLLILGTFIVATLAGCKDLSIFPDNGKKGDGGTEKPSAKQTLKDISQKEFRLVSWETNGLNNVAGKPNIIPVPAGQTYSIIFDNGNVSGQADCNKYFGMYTENPVTQDIAISGLGQTKVACSPESMGNTYINSLSRAYKYEISGTTLRVFWKPEVAIPEDTMWVMNFTASPTSSPCDVMPKIVDDPEARAITGDLCQCPEMPTIENDVMTVTLAYSGGCQEHTFHELMSNAITTAPSQRTTINIVHNANGDLCASVVKKTVRFCLGDLRKTLLQMFEGTTIDYIYLDVHSNGWEYSVPYRFR